ncbi:pyridoxal phosphate-dependent transferase [Auriculariales sp. MPI-PUGE-AT-0066]|nr:pyridoxal phosphate-dependent transferase [Auriculariales sp. MPI-PUGE-AT-0066]
MSSAVGQPFIADSVAESLAELSSATLAHPQTDSRTAALAQELKFDLLSAKQDDVNAQHLHQISRNFVSDTLTAPTPEMLAYAIRGSLGDDVFDEPCTKMFEEHIARISGKEAAIFVPSGTMSNQLALRTHLTQPPHSVLLDARAHIYVHEAGGLAYHSQALPIPVKPSNGHHLTLEDIKENILLSENIHYATTRVIALENTLNGTVIPQEEVVRISEFARENGVIMHMDGARIWHVAIKTGRSIHELCAPFDSVSMCFSKGLGAPIGSVLVGSQKFITKARWLRKLMGGGMRQTGYMAAAATYALNNNFSRLSGVHQLAQQLEQGLRELGVKITTPLETCMVFFDSANLGIPISEVVTRAKSLPDPIIIHGERLVVHVQTSPKAVEDLLALLKQLVKEKQAAGVVPNGSLNDANGAAHNPYEDVRESKKRKISEQ